MTVTSKVKVEVEKKIIYCDSCKDKIGFADECHSSLISLTFTGIGYSAYGGACDSEWDYQLCRKCATALKDFLDAGQSFQDLPEATK